MPRKKFRQTSGYQIVAVNPKTKKIIRNPKPLQMVLYALVGPKGGVTLLKAEDPQRFSHVDFNAMNREVSKAGKNFMLFEQYTHIIRRDKQGRKLYLKKGKYERGQDKRKMVQTTTRTSKPLYTVKYAAPTSTRHQRPILFLGGKRARKTSYFFDLRSRRDIAMLKTPDIVTSGVSIHQRLRGTTLRQSIANLQIPITEAQLKKGAKVFWNAIIRITEPDGNIITIPKVGAYDLPSIKRFTRRPDSSIAIAGGLDSIAKMHQSIAHTLKQALLDNGLTLTRLMDLRKFNDEIMADDTLEPGAQTAQSDAILAPYYEDATEIGGTDHTVSLDITFDIEEP